MCLSGLLGNDKRLLSVITIQLQSIWSIEAIDGPLYGVFLGRKIAAYLSIHSERSSIFDYFQKSVPPFLRDFLTKNVKYSKDQHFFIQKKVHISGKN